MISVEERCSLFLSVWLFFIYSLIGSFGVSVRKAYFNLVCFFHFIQFVFLFEKCWKHRKNSKTKWRWRCAVVHCSGCCGKERGMVSWPLLMLSSSLCPFCSVLCILLVQPVCCSSTVMSLWTSEKIIPRPTLLHWTVHSVPSCAGVSDGDSDCCQRAVWRVALHRAQWNIQDSNRFKEYDQINRDYLRFVSVMSEWQWSASVVALQPLSEIWTKPNKQ